MAVISGIKLNTCIVHTCDIIFDNELECNLLSRLERIDLFFSYSSRFQMHTAERNVRTTRDSLHELKQMYL